jgi:hypothetical protein
MPETISSWGDLKTPADTMTSLRAVSVKSGAWAGPLCTETPDAVLSLSKRICFASVCVYTLRFDAVTLLLSSKARFKKEVCEELRVWSCGLMVRGLYFEPIGSPSIKPCTSVIPSSRKASCVHDDSGLAQFRKETSSGPPD